MEAVKILPGEMWMEVIGKLEDPKDWLSCYNACSLFRDFMEKDKVAALLPAVLGILEERQNSSSSFPPNLELGSKDIRNCRLVSQPWKDSVDRYVSNHPATRDVVLYRDVPTGRHVKNHFETALPVLIDVDKPQDYGKMAEILESWGKSHQDPVLPSRHLVVSDLPFELPIEGRHDMDDQEINFLQLLKKIGPSIRYFGVIGHHQVFFEPYEMEDWFKAIGHCLKLLLNLKCLYISQPNYGGEDPNFNFNQILPHLPNLEVLQYDGLDYEVINCILLSNKHIKKLSINGSMEDENLCRVLESVNFTNLSEFSVGQFINLWWLNCIKFFKSANFPLTKLSLIDVILLREKAIPAEKLFKALKPFKGSLTHLVVGLMKPQKTGVVRVTANLPKLVHLELHLVTRSPSENEMRVEFAYPFDNQNNCKVILKKKVRVADNELNDIDNWEPL